MGNVNKEIIMIPNKPVGFPQLWWDNRGTVNCGKIGG